MPFGVVIGIAAAQSAINAARQERMLAEYKTELSERVSDHLGPPRHPRTGNWWRDSLLDYREAMYWLSVIEKRKAAKESDKR